MDVKDIAAIPREEQVQRLLCCSQPVKDPPWQVGRQLFLEHPEKGEAIPKGRFPFCGQHEGSALCFLQQLTPAQGAHQRPELFPQVLRRKDILLLCEQRAEFMKILRRQALPVHLAGGIRQLVGLVDDQSPVIVQKGPQFLKPMGCIGQQIVVVADLDEDLRTSGLFQVLMVAAAVPQPAGFLADLRNAHLAAVKTAQASDSVQVIIALKGEQRFPLFLVFVLSLDGLQPLGEAGIADKPLLPLANHGPDRLWDDMVF